MISLGDAKSCSRLVAAAALVWLVAILAPRPAGAIALFSEQYEVSCAKCHSVIPHLNAFGAGFAASGDRIPGLAPGSGFPFSAKINFLKSSERQGAGPDGAGLPTAIVDEIELFTSGAIGSRATYFVEQYVVDGGTRGTTRDAWIGDRANPWSAKIPVFVQAGSFTLPLPVEPEAFRDSYQGFAPFEQTVGTNPFTFFDPKIGARLGVGDPLRGLALQFFAGPGHDRQSGIASTGTDTMTELQENIGPLALTAFRYAGRRPTPTGPNDSFERTGYGLVWNQWGRLASESVLVTGWDAQCGIAAAGGCGSSGGFTQLRYQFNRRLYAVARYEGTSDTTGSFARDSVIMFGYGPSKHTRVTVEDVFAHVPQTSHTFNLQCTFAY